MTTFHTQFGLNFTGEIIVDLFAGGGGASTGIEQALGRPVDVAINHDPDAVSMHTLNHPHAKHYLSDVYEVCPLEATAGRPVGLLHASPDCTHHSQARAGHVVDACRLEVMAMRHHLEVLSRALGDIQHQCGSTLQRGVRFRLT